MGSDNEQARNDEGRQRITAGVPTQNSSGVSEKANVSAMPCELMFGATHVVLIAERTLNPGGRIRCQRELTQPARSENAPAVHTASWSLLRDAVPLVARASLVYHLVMTVAPRERPASSASLVRPDRDRLCVPTDHPNEPGRNAAARQSKL